MAIAKKCDLCGTLYEHYAKCKLKKNEVFNGIEFVWINPGGESYSGFDIHYKNLSRIDLCPECKDRLIGFIDTIRKESGIYD